MHQWFGNKKAIFYAPFLFVLLFSVACGSSAEPVVVEKEARVVAMVLVGQVGEVLLHYTSTTMGQMGLSRIATFLQAVSA